jgi:hypothetical protein
MKELPLRSSIHLGFTLVMTRDAPSDRTWALLERAFATHFSTLFFVPNGIVTLQK